ncbi:MAG: hypothetical protein ABSE62_06045 [Chthoniobacteraceae bacterium]
MSELFGAPEPAQILVGGDELFEVEEAFLYTIGRFLVTVGFYRGVSRYACFAKDKRDDPLFDDRDVEVSLALIAPESEWSTSEAESDDDEGPDTLEPTESSWIICEYETTVTDSEGNEVDIVAAHRRFKPYLLAYALIDAPEDEGEDGKLGQLASNMNKAKNLEAKVDAVIALLNELLAQRKAEP